MDDGHESNVEAGHESSVEEERHGECTWEQYGGSISGDVPAARELVRRLADWLIATGARRRRRRAAAAAAAAARRRRRRVGRRGRLVLEMRSQHLEALACGHRPGAA